MDGEQKCPVRSFSRKELWAAVGALPLPPDRSWELKHESRTLSAYCLVQERVTEGEGLLGTRVLQGTKWLSVPVSGGTGPQRSGPSWRQGRGATGEGLGRIPPTPPPSEVAAGAATSKEAQELEQAGGASPAPAWP